MFRWFVLVIGLCLLHLSGAPAVAGESDDAVALQDPAAAGEGVLTAQEEKRKARLEALEALNKGKKARVVVLKQGDVDYSNDVMQRLVKARIVRPDAKFYPDIDLYQAGRREPDRSIRPIDQRATVPEESIEEVNMAVADISPIPWNGMPETEWGLKAQELRTLADQIWFMDRPEVREPLFHLYIQIGRAAENMNNTAPPFYESIEGMPVNYYWFLAGAMAYQDPTLLAKVLDPDLNASVAFYMDQLNNGAYKMMTLSFEEGGEWSPAAFAGEYVVYINGIEVLIDAPDGLYEVPPGRVDIYLERDDGQSISDRIDLDKLGDKVYFVRDVARKRMGIDFAAQLMDHPNECTPELDGDILTYLNIYAKIHAEAETYITVPIGGSPSKLGLWRFDKPSGTLQKVLDDSGSFPVRFAAIVSTGVVMGSYAYTPPSIDENLNAFTSPQLNFGVTGVPLDFQLRGHFVRILVLAGLQLGISPDESGYSDLYQTDGFDVVDGSTSQVKVKALNRLTYFGVGMVLGKQAAIGFGPRGYIRTGWTNIPHTVDVTLHGGITMEAPLPGFEGRIRPLIDIDGFAGVMIPFKYSFLLSGGDSGTGSIKEVPWVLGLTAGIGSTF